MKLTKIQKRLVALSLVALVSVAGCGAGAYAAVTRAPYNFSVSVGNNDTSGEVQKTVEKNYATATVTSYGNTANVGYLRLRARRGGDPVSDFSYVYGTGTISMVYTKSVTTGQSFKLRGFVAENATYGAGVMAGTFEP